MVVDTSSTVALIRGDSARAAAALYTIILLSAVPFLGAALASVALRRATASARLLAWRSIVAALLLLFIGRIPPVHSLVWVVPSMLAAPLVALGRVQVTAGSLLPFRSLVGAADVAGVAPYAAGLVQLFIVVYATGVMTILISTVVALRRVRKSLRGAVRLGEDESSIDELCVSLGVGRRVRVFVSPIAAVPMTWGVGAPVIVLPSSALQWSRAEQRMVLLHELTHVRSADWAFNLLARVVCALYWIHPGAWWIARALRAECELACDASVIASGVRRSDYAEVLLHAAEALGPDAPRGVALALSARSGLRTRLTAVLDSTRDTRPLSGVWAPVAAAATIAVACPMSAVRLAPTRDVLTTLMRDARWESRAYAVLGLAQRRDSVAVARSAAERDPSPRVRAWARYALGQTTERPVDIVVPNARHGT